MQDAREGVVKAFVSYTHDNEEHKEKALELANVLNAKGIDCNIDQYEEAPDRGWPRWMLDNIKSSNYVIVVCSSLYKVRAEQQEEAGKGKGGKWEGLFITNDIYENDAVNKKYIPVFFEHGDIDYVPDFLMSSTYYDLSAKDGFEKLYRRLTNQRKIIKPKLGPTEKLEVAEHRYDSLTVASSPKINTFLELCKAVYPLLSENKKFFLSTGPNSGVDSTGEVRWELELWYKARVDIIVPNNSRIVRLIRGNENVIPQRYKAIFDEFIVHAYAFEAHVTNPAVSYSDKQFPREFSKIVIETCIESNQANGYISEIKGNIVSLLNEYALGLERAVMVGSIISMADASNDIDVFFLSNDASPEFNSKLEGIVKEIQKTFSTSLHVTVFSLEEREQFERALQKAEYFNELKIN